MCMPRTVLQKYIHQWCSVPALYVCMTCIFLCCVLNFISSSCSQVHCKHIVSVTDGGNGCADEYWASVQNSVSLIAELDFAVAGGSEYVVLNFLQEHSDLAEDFQWANSEYEKPVF